MADGMTEHVVYLESLPTIPDRECCDDCKTTVRHFWNSYQTWIILVSILIILSGIVITVMMTSKTYSYPCLAYSSQTLASSVSLDCLQYMWNVNCATRSPYTFAADYQGWWNRSPQGANMVRCSSTPQCGVGSYNNIITYMSFCNINPP